MNTTIFALATAAGKAGIAIIRVSGPCAFDIAKRLTGKPVSARVPSLRKLVAKSGLVLDEVLVLPFKAGSSFTGEDVVEFQCHGSPAVVNAVLGELSGFENTRQAEPGEFTRRALENGCLDLSQVEGLADLLEAETEAQRAQAFRIMRGELSEKVGAWRAKMIRAAALVAATIDFADEDVPVDVSPEVASLLDDVKYDLERELQGSHSAERIRDGFEVAIVGPPNVGKSTLLNALARREAAITSEFAGTTRDIIEVRLDIEGLPVTLLDTAGLRETGDHVEKLGIELAIKRAIQADLRIFLTGPDHHIESELGPNKEDIVLVGKSDLLDAAPDESISGKSGSGVDRLLARISSVLSQRSTLAMSAVRQRHRIAIEQALSNIVTAESLLMDFEGSSEFLAMELGFATQSLESLIGHVGVENLLDEIFTSFCLGK